MPNRARRIFARRLTLTVEFICFPRSWSYDRLLAPPPDRALRAPEPEVPTLEAPRALLAWALALLDAPPKALVFRDASLLGICRLPILFPPPPLRLAPVLLGLTPGFEPARFVAELPRLLGLAPAFEAGRFAAVVPRLLALGCCLLLAPSWCRELCLHTVWRSADSNRECRHGVWRCAARCH